MRHVSVNITGAGPHSVIDAVPGMRIIVTRIILTFSHAEPQAQPVAFYSGPDLIAGPFFILDGGEVEYERREGDATHMAIGESFNVLLADGLSAAGVLNYELGGA